MKESNGLLLRGLQDLLYQQMIATYWEARAELIDVSANC
jgi:hypothetical protein